MASFTGFQLPPFNIFFVLYYRNMNNPWQVDNLQAFTFLCCPECHFRSKEEYAFQDHALSSHPDSQIFFNGHMMQNSTEMAVKVEPVDTYKYEEEYSSCAPSSTNCDLAPITSDPLDIPVGSFQNSEDLTGPSSFYPTNDNTLVTANQDDNQGRLSEIILEPQSNTDYENPIRKLKRQVLGQCGICNLFFGNTTTLEDHVISTHRNIDDHVMCFDETCGKITVDYLTMLVHIQRDSKHGPNQAPIFYQCQICQIIVNNRANLQRHLEYMHIKSATISSESLNEPVNSFQSIEENAIIKRMMKQVDGRCGICNLHFGNTTTLEDHVTSTHTSVNGRVTCFDKKCGKSTVDYLTMLAHIQRYSKHGKNKAPIFYQCQICQKVLCSKRMLQMHFEGGHEKRKTKCPICNKEVLSYILRNHIAKVHEAEKKGGIPFDCEECNYQSPHRHYLKQHIIKKHLRGFNGQLYKCTFCALLYPQVIHLKRHMIKHHVEKLKPVSKPKAH